MKKSIKSILSAFIILTLLTFSITPAFAEDTGSEFSGEYAQTIVRMAMSIVKSNYKFDITDEELYRNALYQVLKEHPEVWESAFKGIYDNLDQHSMYFTEDEFKSFTDDLSGEICGIGVGIMEFADGLLITRVYTDSPASKSGLQIGDIIVSADGFDVRGEDINVAKSYITGEKGTSVKIGFIRDDEYFEADITRDQVRVDSGRYYTAADDTVGYIQLYSFDEHSNEFIRSALNLFDQKGITDIIMDLRNNPGGSLIALQEISQNFIPAGPVIYIEYKNPLRNYSLTSTNENPKYNLIVLTNENSASAAEAFSAAVQDTGVGIVLGTQSYGKGTMQNVTKFKVGGGIKLTEAVYLTPNRRDINGIGVEPDLKIKDKEIKYEDSDMTPISYERILKLGDSGSDVYAIKERLDFMGYNIDMSTDLFDESTLFAVKKFQEVSGLFPYGEMDLTTQLHLENQFIGQKVSDNSVYKKAIEIFSTGTIDQYKHTWSPDDYKNIKK